MTPWLTGCGGSDIDEMQAYVDQTRSEPPKPIEPLPQFKQAETFVYDPEDRRDPFSVGPVIPPPPPDGPTIAPPEDRRKEELEQFALDSLAMVGTLDRDTTRWALIETPDGVVHRVRVGNYLGQNHGQIMLIAAERLKFTELVEDRPGQWSMREAQMPLRN